MKISASYSFFDGEEWLEESIKNIYEHVDLFSIVFQEYSNYGAECSEKAKSVLSSVSRLDKVYIHRFDPDKNLPAAKNEINKRNIGLNIGYANRCTHHIAMDADELYTPEQFAFLKQDTWANNWAGTACQMKTFWKKRDLFLDPPEDYYVSLLYDIRDIKYGYSLGWNGLPVLIDPTRRIPVDKNRFKSYSRDEIEMQHMSYVRDDIRSKVNNSSAKQNFNHLILEFLEYWDNWEEGDDAMMLGTELKKWKLKNLNS